MTIDFPTRKDVKALRSLWREAFGDSEEFLDAFTATAMDASRCLMATVDGQLAAALYWFDCSCRGKKMAYLYAVATAKAFRGQGICRKLMTHTHGYLQKNGYAGTLLVPGEESLFGFYEKMGYSVCCTMRAFPCTPDGNAIALRPVDAEEYGRLRRQLLPEGSVIQEEENLDFLSTMAKFYAGTGLLLAAHKEGQKLTAYELLGDRTAAPGVLTALGCSQGEFRIFGEGTPFAMYRPLSNDPPPAYFAFAFD